MKSGSLVENAEKMIKFNSVNEIPASESGDQERDNPSLLAGRL